MIQVIHGKKGSGKTKKIIDMANDAVDTQHGDVVFIDDDNRYMLDLRHQVRFVNASEYSIASPEMLYGFVSGMLAQNFDAHCVYIDAFLKLVKAEPKETAWFFEKLEAIGNKLNVLFVLSVSCDDEEAPDFIKQYFI